MSAKEIAISWSNHSGMIGKKSICCIGSLLVQAIIPWMNGNGFIGNGDILGIIVLFFSNRFAAEHEKPAEL